MIDDEFLSQFPSMQDANKGGYLISMPASIEQCKRDMPVLEAEKYMHSRERNNDRWKRLFNGEVKVVKKSSNGEVKTYNPLHLKNLKTQGRVT